MPTADTPTIRFPRTERILLDGLQAGEYPGVQLHVSRAGQGAQLCLGSARPHVPVAPGTVMPWLSAGKPLTAVAIAQLWEEGKLDIDDPVAAHVPGFGVRGKGAITLRHVLTHTGGFRCMVDIEGSAVDGAEALALACAARQERDWRPGARAAYQARSGWQILGEVVQRRTGEPLARRIRDRILVPAGMNDSWLAASAERVGRLGERLAELYDTSGSRPRVAEALAGPAAAQRGAPGAGARGPMADLGRFYEMLLAGGVGPRGERVLRAPTVVAMTARHRVGLVDETFGHIIDFGLGFIIDSNRYGADTVPYGYGRHCSGRTFGHGGSQCCAAFADPEPGLVVALAVNGRPGEKRYSARFRSALTALYEDLELTQATASTGEP